MDDGETIFVLIIIIAVSFFGGMYFGSFLTTSSYREGAKCDQYQVWEYQQKVVPLRCEGTK